MLLLRIGAVVQQQLGRAKRVRNRHRRGHRRRHRGDLHQHPMMAIGGEAQAAVFLRDDHAEETLLLEELPHRLGQVGQFVGNLPFVDHRAQRFHRAVHERLLIGAQLRRRLAQQDLPVRTAGKQLALETDGAGLQRHPFGFRQRGQHLLVQAQHRCSQELAPGRQMVERNGDHRQQQPSDRGSQPVHLGAEGDHGQHHGADHGPVDQLPAVVGGNAGDQQQGEEGQDIDHGGRSFRQRSADRVSG